MMMMPTGGLYVVIAVAGVLVLLRTVLSLRAVLHLLGRCWRWLDDRAYAHQSFTIPRYGESSQENPLYRRAAAYVGSLPSLDDSDCATLYSSARKPNDVFLQPDPGQPVHDSFLGARLSWTSHPDRLALRLRRQDRRRVLRPYLQHVESVAEEIELRRREVRLFTASASPGTPQRWDSVPFTHPATLDTVAMDQDLKNRLRADLEAFLKGRAYYHRLGRVWRRSYLLYGPPGTGKSSFVAAMAKFLCYDIYDVDLSQAADLRALLLQTSPRSVILVEDLDRYLAAGEGGERLTGMLNFMDGIFSCCGEERVMVFTMTGGGEGKEAVDPAVLRPGRLDVHVHFPMCDFTAFKTLASSYLGLKDHKLYPQVEEGFQSGAALSPAEVGEIMIANRGSPSRALKSVISAMQRSLSSSGGGGRRSSESGSVNGGRPDELAGSEGCVGGAGLGFGKDATIREFRKLYGMIRMRNGSKRDGVLPLEALAAAAAGNTTAAVEKDR